MSHNLINLLPRSRIHALRRGYFMRLATVSLIVLSFVLLVHTVLLIPSYLLLSGERTALEAEAARLGAELSAAESTNASVELARLEEEARYLTRLEKAPSASSAVRAMLTAPRDGIIVSGISYTPPVGTAQNGKMVLTGEAKTRDSLRAYSRALETVPGVTSVDLPIASYAKEADIPFSITLTGSLMP